MQIRLDIDFSITPRAKAAIKWVGLPVAVFAGTVSIAHAMLTPDPTVWAQPGLQVSAASLRSNLLSLDSRLAALEQPVSARVTMGSNQMLPNVVSTLVVFDTIVYDPAGAIRGLGTAGFMYQAPVDGTYSVHTGVLVPSGSVAFPAATSVGIEIHKNGVLYSQSYQESSGANSGELNPVLADTVQLHAGQYITILASQNSGSPRLASGANCFLAVDRVGP